MENEIGIIKSLIDSDLYKLTMQQAVCKLFPRVKVKYKFINRGKTQFPEGFAAELRKEIAKMASLTLKKEEKSFLNKRCGKFLDEVYIDFLNGYRYDPSEVGVTQKGGDLDIEFYGYWYRTILWEVPIMSLVSELYFKMTGQEIEDFHTRTKNIQNKGQLFHQNSMKLADFGSRRRYSFDNQLEVCKTLKAMFGSEKFFVGTSNVYIAFLLDITPIGTHAHEWFMFMGAKYGFKMANEKALEYWVDVYQGDLGIALSDTYTTNIFFKSFNKKYAKLFDGVRHDSGDPFKFIDKTVAHYISLGINPADKTIVFSNALDKDLSLEIAHYCRDKGNGIKCSFGIGTNLTNDVGVKPLNIVIKMVSAEIDGEWVETVKLSDDEGKHTGDSETVDLALKLLKIKNEEVVSA